VFVSNIDASTGDVTVGEAASARVSEVLVDQPVIGPLLRLPAAAVVQVRYRHAGAPATLTWCGSSLRITFNTPVRTASPGQVAVAYDRDVIMAGGTISRSVRAPIARPTSEVAT
jgi:tRNA-specific 2-thiouridylase